MAGSDGSQKRFAVVSVVLAPVLYVLAYWLMPMLFSLTGGSAPLFFAHNPMDGMVFRLQGAVAFGSCPFAAWALAWTYGRRDRSGRALKRYTAFLCLALGAAVFGFFSEALRLWHLLALAVPEGFPVDLRTLGSALLFSELQAVFLTCLPACVILYIRSARQTDDS